MPDPISVTILGIVGASCGASEKAVSLLKSIWPAKRSSERSILVALVDELPSEQRSEAKTQMELVYKTLDAVDQRVRHYQRSQAIGSLVRVATTTTGIILAVMTTQTILSQINKLTSLAVIVSLVACLLLSILASWFSVHIYAPKIEPILTQASKGVQALLDKSIYEKSEALRDQLTSLSSGSALQKSFLTAYEELAARTQALEDYTLKLQFVKANQSIQFFFWGKLEEALVEALSKLAESGKLEIQPGYPTAQQAWEQRQEETIRSCLRETGMEDIFFRGRYASLWKEDLAVLLKGPEGKDQLLFKLRQISKVPKFGLL